MWQYLGEIIREYDPVGRKQLSYTQWKRLFRTNKNAASLGNITKQSQTRKSRALRGEIDFMGNQ